MDRSSVDGFVALIPARRAATRLPDKPLLDVGGVPMVVRVARQARASGATRVAVATDDPDILAATRAHGIEAVMTDAGHASGTDRLAEAAAALRLDADTIVVNVQGDEPLIPPPVIAQVAGLLAANPDCSMSTAAHPLADAREHFDPNVVKVVLDHRGHALLFSRAPLPWSRDAFAARAGSDEPGPRAAPAFLPPGLPALRHIGLYAYRTGFLLRYPGLERPAIEQHENLEQLRALWHGARIAVLQLAAALPPGVDTPADLARVRAALAAAPRAAGAGGPGG